MKTYVFFPLDNSFKVSYLTNAIGTNDRLFINEIKSEKNGQITTGLINDGQAVGLFSDYLEVTHKQLLAKAEALNMNLMVYEDRQAEVNINEKLADFLSFSTPTSAAVVINTVTKTITLDVPNGTVVTGLVATFRLSNSATAKVGVTTQVSGTTANNFTSPVTYAITAKDGVTVVNYTVTVTVL